MALGGRRVDGAAFLKGCSAVELALVGLGASLCFRERECRREWKLFTMVLLLSSRMEELRRRKLSQEVEGSNVCKEGMTGNVGRAKWSKTGREG